MTDGVDLGSLYAESRARLRPLVGDLGPGGYATAVAACPGWSVHDTIAHLAGVVEDALAGRLTGPPSAAQTAAEVERHRGEDTSALFAAWDELAPEFERLLTELQIWPGVIDVLSHEHDIRAALARPGARDDRAVVLVAERLAVVDDLPVDIVLTSTPGPASGGAVDGRFELHTTPFEVLRFRLGRRTRDQVRALAWSVDPEPVLDRLFIFGPAQHALVD